MLVATVLFGSLSKNDQRIPGVSENAEKRRFVITKMPEVLQDLFVYVFYLLFSAGWKISGPEKQENKKHQKAQGAAVVTWAQKIRYASPRCKKKKRYSSLASSKVPENPGKKKVRVQSMKTEISISINQMHTYIGSM